MKKAGLFNIPNVLTCIRLFLVPVFALAYFLLPHRRWIALVIFLAASVTDVVDGYLARRLNQITWFGKLFDPAADKLMCATMLFCLALTGYIPWWSFGAVFAKELYMAFGAFYMYSRRFVVKSDLFGKAATFLFVVAIVLVYPWHENARLSSIGRGILYLAVALSFAAAAHYTWMALKRSDEYRP